MVEKGWQRHWHRHEDEFVYMLEGELMVDDKNGILAAAKARTKRSSKPAAVTEDIAAAVEDAASKAGLKRRDLAAVSVGAPGSIDRHRGVVHDAPNLGWDEYPLGAELEKRLRVPVLVDNDVYAGTVGEHALGAGAGASNLMGIFVGTGIGGGIIANGRLYEGSHGGAGEIGLAQHDAGLDRHLERVERGEQAGLALIGEIAVPEAARVFHADCLAVFVQHVGDDQDLRVTVQAVFLAHVLLEDTKAAGEGDLLLRGDPLVPEDDHLVLEECHGYAGEGAVVEGLGEVDSANLGTQVLRIAGDRL